MEPDFHSGQDVLVQRIPSGPDLQFGEIGAFIVGNETYIKEYREDGLHSLNPEYAPLRFDESESVYLIGRVLGILDKASYANAEDIAKYEAVHA
jgi:SOS-response transcriptional repressor LexA